MTQTITVTLQLGDGEAQTAHFGLPDAPEMDVDSAASDPIDTILPPALDTLGDGGSEADGSVSEDATPPDFDGDSAEDEASETGDDDTGSDDDDAIAPPEV